MRRSTALMSLAAVAVFASNAFAQAKTSFAGTWNIVVDPAAAAQQQGGAAGGRQGGRGMGGGGFGQTFSIAQDEKTLTMTRTQGQNEIKTVWNLDGSDSKNTVTMGRGGQTMEQISKAKWEGANLVVTTTQQRGEMSVEIKRTLSIDASGNLVVETSAPGQDGNPMVSKVTYKKA